MAIPFLFSFFCLSKNGTCRYNPKYSAAKVVGFMSIPPSENALMKAVATVGPISVGIDIKHKSFQFYKGGKCFLYSNHKEELCLQDSLSMCQRLM